VPTLLSQTITPRVCRRVVSVRLSRALRPLPQGAEPLGGRLTRTGRGGMIKETGPAGQDYSRVWGYELKRVLMRPKQAEATMLTGT